METLAWSYALAIKAGPKSVLTALAWRADRRTWRARPGVSQLSTDTGLDERSVRRNLDWLEAHGFVARWRRHAESGRRRGERLADEFELNPDRGKPVKSPATSPDNSPANDCDTTGQFDGDNRTNLRGQPDILSPPYKDEPSNEPRNRTQRSIGDHLFSEKLRKARRKKLTPMPDQWPDEADRLKAIEYWRSNQRPDLVDSIELHAEQARDHHLAKGTRFVDWSAAWRTWFRNALKFDRGASRTNVLRDVTNKLMAEYKPDGG